MCGLAQQIRASDAIMVALQEPIVVDANMIACLTKIQPATGDQIRENMFVTSRIPVFGFATVRNGIFLV